ncbi:MAG: protein phosphatase 2C domain-containing protein [Pyrinomonadaceae bacterium]|nr:protein phosphatase 2C domain-containing protein [Pyrinomonadaceae bacterium]
MLIVEAHATSHVGRVRKGNEDNYLMLDITNSQSWTSSQDAGDFYIVSQKFEVDENGIILAVADGMGGALAGEVASEMAVDTVKERLMNGDPDATISPEISNASLIEKLFESTLYANHLIHRQGRSDAQFNGMGATFTGVGVTKQSVDITQVGDSRVYLIRNAKIIQLTKDQSLVQQLIDSGQIQPEEAESHTFKNVILQALGAQSEIYPVASRLIPKRGDVLLVCSDGLSNKIRNGEMLQIIIENDNNLAQAAAQLVKTANENGGEDNITLILAKLSGSGLPEPTEEEAQVFTLNFTNIHDTNDQEDTAEVF